MSGGWTIAIEKGAGAASGRGHPGSQGLTQLLILLDGRVRRDQAGCWLCWKYRSRSRKWLLLLVEEVLTYGPRPCTLGCPLIQWGGSVHISTLQGAGGRGGLRETQGGLRGRFRRAQPGCAART